MLTVCIILSARAFGTRKMQGQDDLPSRRTHRATKASSDVVAPSHTQNLSNFLKTKSVSHALDFCSGWGRCRFVIIGDYLISFPGRSIERGRQALKFGDVGVLVVTLGEPRDARPTLMTTVCGYKNMSNYDCLGLSQSVLEFLSFPGWKHNTIYHCKNRLVVLMA